MLRSFESPPETVSATGDRLTRRRFLTLAAATSSAALLAACQSAPAAAPKTLANVVASQADNWVEAGSPLNPVIRA